MAGHQYAADLLYPADLHARRLPDRGRAELLTPSRLDSASTSRHRAKLQTLQEAFRYARCPAPANRPWPFRSEEHTSELQSLMRISYAVFCLKKKTQTHTIWLYIRSISIDHN